LRVPELFLVVYRPCPHFYAVFVAFFHQSRVRELFDIRVQCRCAGFCALFACYEYLARA
jgi:hypothetical protein